MKKLLAFLIALTVPAFADYQPLVKATAPKVVTIYVRGIGTPEPTVVDILTTTIPKERLMTFIGSGSIIKDDGIILTCNHLFNHDMKDRRVSVKLANGMEFRAIILAQDHDGDLALLKIFPLHKLSYFTLGGPLHRGQEVLSFGSPLGWEKHVSFGYVENLNKSDGVRRRTVHGATINPGNSGGPLVDVRGRLVGVNIETLVGHEAMNLSVTLRDIRGFLGE